jgi:hypothetical protein
MEMIHQIENGKRQLQLENYEELAAAIPGHPPG